jgi:actin-like protein 6A
MYSEEVTGVVIDIGNSSCRAGYSGEDVPKALFPSAVGVFQEETANNDMELEGLKTEPKLPKNSYAVDFQLKNRRDNMEILETCKKGIFTDYDAVERLIHEIYYQKLSISPAQYPLLMSEPSLHHKDQRQKICELAFEKFGVPAYFSCKAGVLSCFASGRSTSLILDTGASSTYAVPVHDGYALQKCMLKYDLGGEYLTEKVRSYVEETLKIPIVPRYNVQVKVDAENQKKYDYVEYGNTHPNYEYYCKMEIARDIKENIVRIMSDPKDVATKQEATATSPFTEKVEYELPDGKRIIFGPERFNMCEGFFNGALAKQDYKDFESATFKGFHQMIMESINKCDIDLRKELLSNIIVTGGNSLVPGFVEALQKKLYDIAPQNAKVKLIAYPLSVERRFSTWIGGSILSSLGSFQSMWIGKAEYDEVGSYIVEKKCP